jgi:uncharacterized protein (TIGR00725 family)
MSSPQDRVRRRAIAVIGAGSCDSREAAAAYEIGRLVARRGAAVVTGGLSGVMEAASRGARDAGGLVIGILPGVDPAAANEAVEVAVPTGLGQLRNGLVVLSAGAVIAVGGEWGTLSEIGFALKHDKPVIGWNTWELGRRGEASGAIVQVATPDEAVEAAFARYGD